MFIARSTEGFDGEGDASIVVGWPVPMALLVTLLPTCPVGIRLDG